MSTTIHSTTSASGTSATAGATATSTSNAESADRFLKLLVAQMQNQDPLNPMDNAQVTSQMAQINTVTGIEKLNTTVNGLSSQFVQMQAVQGAALVGRTILHEGNAATVSEGGFTAGFDLDGPADTVQVEVLNASGRVIDTQQLGAAGAGRQGFDWTAPEGTSDGESVTFRITAKSGTSAVSATPLVIDTVKAVSSDTQGLVLELGNGSSIHYSDITALS
jgi:flagellar basal-body rod modification protein FlgD